MPSASDRQYPVQGVRIDLPDDLVLAAPIDGAVRLSRTNRGILADADLTTSIEGACSRCLGPVDPAGPRDPTRSTCRRSTSRPACRCDLDDEPDALRLTDHHELDLEPAVREAIVLAEPIAPLCRPDCPGLCIVCGQPLEAGDHDHPDDDIDPRLEALRGFQADDG